MEPEPSITHLIIKGNYGYLIDVSARLMATVEEDVLVQLETLRTHPTVSVSLAGGKLDLHDSVYKLETAQVLGDDQDEHKIRLIRRI